MFKPRQFNLRKLALVIAATSLVMGALSWLVNQAGLPPLVYLPYSFPIVGGMGGILLGDFRGGLVGVTVGTILFFWIIFIGIYAT